MVKAVHRIFDAYKMVYMITQEIADQVSYLVLKIYLVVQKMLKSNGRFIFITCDLDLFPLVPAHM